MLFLHVGHVVPATEAEGPGRRFALWVQGCPLRCPGCCNPELLGFAGGRQRTVDEVVAEILATASIEGVSFLGGEPTAQAAAVLEVARQVRGHGLSVMVFTGFTRAELEARGDATIDALLACTDLLVDGRYERDRPETGRRWIGSANQIMHFLSDRYAPDDPRFGQPNTVEIRLDRGGLLVNGWPDAAQALGGALARRRRRSGAGSNLP